MSFKDHFSGLAADYARFRPGYPAELFEQIAALAPARRVAWDCATGSGQVASGLKPRFEHVVGTDASLDQLTASDAIRWPVRSRAESSGLRDGCADLIAVGQAVHWFDLDRFWSEARRVLTPRGIVAVWTYTTVRVDSEVDPIVDRLYERVAPWWPAERRLVEARYEPLELPFDEEPFPRLATTVSLSADELLGYLGTWSAVRRAARSSGRDPLEETIVSLRDAWPDGRRTVRFPLYGRIGRR